MTALTKVDRAGMRATTKTPWRAHCHVCCCRIEVCEEDLVPGDVVPLPECSWWFASQPEALAKALSHLAEHVEVSG